MDKKELAAKAVELLKKEYPDALCSLEYVKPHELLFATRLAAQCKMQSFCSKKSDL